MSKATVPVGWTSRVVNKTQKFYVADNLDTGGSSSGSTLGATWTGLTHGTAGVAVIATFLPTGVNASAPRLVQASYTDSAILQRGGSSAWNSQPYPVNPKAGNRLVAFMNGSIYHPAIDCGSVLSVTDTAGNTWVKAGESGPDNGTGINISCWTCDSARGGPTVLTPHFSNASQQLCCLLLEFANMPPPVIVESVASRSGGGDLPYVTTAGSVPAGCMAMAYRACIYAEELKGPGPGGWKQLISDSTGANCQILHSTPAGIFSTSWSGTVSLGLDILLVVFGPG